MNNQPANTDGPPRCENCGQIEAMHTSENKRCTTYGNLNIPIRHWKLMPATDDRTADTIPGDLKRDYEDARGGGHFSYGNYHVARIIERTGCAETRIEVLEAALRKAWGANIILSQDAGRTADMRAAYGRICEAISAALAAPSGVKP